MKRLSFLALLALVFVMPWENLVTISGIGALSRVIGIASVVVYALTIGLRGTVRRPHRLQMLALCFVTWGAVTAIWSPDRTVAMTRVATNGQILLMLWMLWDLVREPEQHAQVLQAFVLGAFVSIVGTVVSFRAGASVSAGRYVASGFDPNDLGIILVLAIPFSLRLARCQTIAALKAVNRAYPIVACPAVLLTGSRAAGVALVAVLVGALFSMRRSSAVTKVIGFASVLMVAWIALRFVPQDTWMRLLSTKQEILDGSFSNRSDIWRSGIEMFLTRPLFGVGIGGFAVTLSHISTDAMVAHNTFLSVMAEQGLVGLLLFLAVLVSTGISLRSLQETDRLYYLLALVVLGAAFATLTFEPKKETWFVFGLVPVAASASLRRRFNAASPLAEEVAVDATADDRPTLAGSVNLVSGPMR